MISALVIGAGPAGLMAAEELARAGLDVTVADRMPSPARKFLMAGKSGLNLTKSEDAAVFRAAYGAVSPALAAALDGFGPPEVIAWAEALGQPVFTGSTGRVFPVAMKASPLLRAWLGRLDGLGVALHTRWAWRGWDGARAVFDTPGGIQTCAPLVTVLAMGGASWSRLGSDGAWAAQLPQQVAPFRAANAGLRVAWSDHMARHFGAPVKGVAMRSGDLLSRGEVVLTPQCIEGGGIYPLGPALRAGCALTIDLMPDHKAQALAERLARGGSKLSLGNRLRRAGVTGVKQALALEMIRNRENLARDSEMIRNPQNLARMLKSLPVPHQGLAPMDQAISTAGGLRFDALDDDLMLTARPGVFAAGEMLDWEAPTGGYLLTACLATGRLAGRAAAAYALRSVAR